MKRISFFVVTTMAIVLISCKKESIPVESEYRLTPAIVSGPGSVSGATISGEFTMKRNTPTGAPNSYVGQINGVINWQGLAAAADTVALKANGSDIVSLNKTTTSAMWANFSNGTAGSFSFSGWPFTDEVSAAFVANAGLIKIGTPGNYIYVQLSAAKIR